MNENRKEELLTRWMDEELSDEELRELEPLLAEQPELHEEREHFRKLRKDLQAAIPAEVEPPSPDFFNTHLERLVQDAGHHDSRPGRVSRRGGLGRMWALWLAPAAAAAVVAAFLLGLNSAKPSGPPVTKAHGSDVYSPISTVSWETIDETLIVVEGLEELSDQDLVVGDGSMHGEHGFFVNTDDIY